MSDIETRFHEAWLGLVQPTEGLVVSIPALVDAQCMARVSNDLVERFLEVCPHGPDGERFIADLPRFFEHVLGHAPAAFDAGAALPDALQLFVPEGRQTLRPSFALKRAKGDVATVAVDASPAAQAAAPYVALVWDLPDGLDLDASETVTGSWDYPPAAKLDRLLREARVPIGLLTNRRVVRLLYAPHGESSGSITFRIDHMATTGGRPILDAFVMLLGAHSFFTAAEAQSLPAILKDSRARQANVTNELADQVLEAIQILLRGFEQAYERDKSPFLDEAIAEDEARVYGGLLTVLLRLVFVLYAEAWGLVPNESPIWARDYSVLALFEELRADAGANPDSMSRRFGAWGRLLAVFRAIYLGVEHASPAGALRMPPRRGDLFNPERYPFLEGWAPVGGAPINDPAARSAVRVPSIDDETVYRVLERLILLGGQRLSYRNLDVEQLGSVYEGLMGYHVERLATDAVALKVKDKPSAARAWVPVATLLEVPSARRGAWLEDELGFDKASAKKVVQALEGVTDAGAGCDALLDLGAGRAGKSVWRARSDKRARFFASRGRLVLQPGPERRRTSSHYTPRSLSAPIVRRTLEPLLAVMGEHPSSERILNLKVCDPAMGSGAFLVEACRFLADEVMKAWAREDAGSAAAHHTLLEARRLVAQRCLYGVDKNAYAVELAKLSLWLVTLARDLPFTFLDHSLRHGDSLVGLDFDQIRAGHWKPGKQAEMAETTLREALNEAIAIRQEIVALAEDPSPSAQRLKEQKLADANDALGHARLLADLVVGAFFAHEKDKDREKERARRVDAFAAWKRSAEVEVPAELLAWQHDLRARVPAFHWMLEFPEVFYAERPDPLDSDQVNRAAYMDAFIGNPPFAGKNGITEANGEGYIEWLQAAHVAASGAADLSAHFFRRAGALLGAHGTIGLIATNTIAQGDTRDSGLRHMVRQGDKVYDATRSMMWPEPGAAVAVSVVHLARGSARAGVRECMLDGGVATAITSRLTAGEERPDLVALTSNAGGCFVGTYVLGTGFALGSIERERLVDADQRNSERIHPFLGGEEVNSNPTQSYERFVVNFGRMSLEEAAKWPTLLDLVRERVKPERDKLKDNADGADYKARWWQFAKVRVGLGAVLNDLTRCLVCARVTKHLCFSFQSTDQVFNEKLYIFPFENRSPFCVLQSRVHTAWAWLLSSTMKTDLNYSASDCFENFAFPRPDPRAVIPSLEDIGQRLYDARAKYMVDEQVGLTITYNRLKDPTVTEARIVELRRLHEEMDAAVLAAYGWSDIPVPPFCLATDADQKAFEAFESEVIDRLFALNAKRAEEERLAGAGAEGKPKGAKKVAPKKGRPGGGGQTDLF
ncbi:MAG: DNA methyltransferase [Sandaracinus sp.]